MSGAFQELEVERSVRDLLYGARYRLLERVGAGGMATVYRARDERLKRDVAVKVIAEHLSLDPLAVRRFRREAELAARLAHPNVVAVLDAGGSPQDFIVMELVLGVDAGRLLKGSGRLTPGQAVRLVAQICDALAHVHDQGVVHRDVSPHNILIRRLDGTAKLADFGLASDVLELPPGRVADVAGTPGYIAPEVLRGARPSPRSDLYALGVVAYRLLAGPSQARPGDLDATSPLATAAPRVAPLAEVRPGLPPELSDAVHQALSDEPDERQDSLEEFHAQLVEGQSSPLRLLELSSAA
jgi:serine/threonine protein kinase